MHIHQFYDEGLAHASYAILSKREVIFIDPARNPQPYLSFAEQHQARVVAVIETHPHADFVSAHLELHQLTAAPIYTSRFTSATYPHEPFNEDVEIRCGDTALRAIETPGHSPDSLCALLVDESANPYAVFTGDTLFVGDVGRPDLREDAGKNSAKAALFSENLYRSLHQKLAILPPEVIVYPAHGPGSLCGKNMGSDLQSTIGREFSENYALQPMEIDEFVALILKEQPFVPKYFAYNVELNKKGAPPFKSSIAAIAHIDSIPAITDHLVIDGRQQALFKAGHYPNAINIPDGLKFETWLGSVVAPHETFYLSAGDPDALDTLLEKAAKIGYESLITGVVIAGNGPEKSAVFDVDAFRLAPETFTIVDIRNTSERSEHNSFAGSIHIPLHKLRERVHEVPTERPIVVHCAGGYRSAIGTSILSAAVKRVPVFDMGAAIHEFSTTD